MWQCCEVLQQKAGAVAGAGSAGMCPFLREACAPLALAAPCIAIPCPAAAAAAHATAVAAAQHPYSLGPRTHLPGHVEAHAVGRPRVRRVTNHHHVAAYPVRLLRGGGAGVERAGRLRAGRREGRDKSGRLKRSVPLGASGALSARARGRHCQRRRPRCRAFSLTPSGPAGRPGAGRAVHPSRRWMARSLQSLALHAFT